MLWVNWNYNLILVKRRLRTLIICKRKTSERNEDCRVKRTFHRSSELVMPLLFDPFSVFAITYFSPEKNLRGSHFKSRNFKVIIGILGLICTYSFVFVVVASSSVMDWQIFRKNCSLSAAKSREGAAVELQVTLLTVISSLYRKWNLSLVYRIQHREMLY